MTSRSTSSHPRAQQRAWARTATLYQAAAILTFAIALMSFAARADLAAGRWTLVPGVGGMLVAAALFAEHLTARGRAARHQIGADSEQVVADQLKQLGAHGYRITHGARWAGGGDIDHLVRTPDGLGILIETKTRSYNAHHLDRLRRQADWATHRRQYPRGVLPVLCIARDRDLQQIVDGALISSPNQLINMITAAHTTA